MTFDPADILRAHILIVDDQPPNVLLLEQVLSQAGYENVFSTLDSREVSALHQANGYDLILLDLQMPGMDGFDVMMALQAHESESYLPVIAVTAQPDHKVRALRCGAKDFISKPFDLIELKTRIHNMLEVRLLYKTLKNYNAQLEQTVQERTAELRASEARYRRMMELASDWYWEQDDAGDFTKVTGPVLELLSGSNDDSIPQDGQTRGGWDEVARVELKARIAARRPFLDLLVSRVNSDGSRQRYQVSGEPIFNGACGYIGYRGIGVELTTRK